MSAFAATLSFHHPAPPPEPLQRLLDAQRHAGPDGQRRLVSGPCHLGLCVMTTTPEDHLDPPCMHDAQTDLFVTIDGSLSNREELAAALGMSGGELAVTGDARLIARAYAAWGLDAFAQLDGAYAVTLWDNAGGQLVIARDVFGVRPVYYTLDDTHVRAASELHALLAESSADINEGMVGELLVWRRTSADETLFARIRRVPPAHLLVVSRGGGVTVQRYWTPDLDTEAAPASDDEYAEACRHHVAQAVRGAMRSDRVVSIMLSGGIDSGAIAATAAEQGARVQALTVGFPGSDVDEASWAEETAAFVHIPWRVVPPGIDHHDFDEEVRATRQLPSYPSNANSVTLRAAARESDSRVLVTGMGGDEWLYGSDWRYADLLQRGRLVEWTRELWADRGIYAWAWRRLLRDSVLPMIPRHRWDDLARVVGRASRRGMIDAGFASRIHLEDRLRRDVIPAARLHARRDLGRAFFNAGSAAAHEEMAQLGSRTGTVHRHPFLSRRFAEFALSLPEAQRRQRGVTKRVLRRAYRPCLPVGVTDRVTCFTYDFLSTRALRRLLAGGLFSAPQVVARGWVDEVALRAGVEAVTRGPEAGPAADAALRLWPTAAVEVWLSRVLR